MAARTPVRPEAPAAIGRVAEDLLRRVAVLAAAAARARAGGDARAVHDLRVAARRLEAALRTWGPAAGPAAGRAADAARRATRLLRRAAGGARELEVHVLLLEAQVRLVAGAGRPALRALLEDLRSRRDGARERLARRLPQRRLERLSDRVAAVALALARAPVQLAGADRAVSRARRAAARHLHEAADTTHDGRLHGARIALKKWRYAEESRAAAPRPQAPAPFAELRAVQKSLGEVHDHAVLRELLWRRARRAGEPARPAALEAVVSRLERARLARLKGLPRRLRDLAGAVRR